MENITRSDWRKGCYYCREYYKKYYFLSDFLFEDIIFSLFECGEKLVI